MHRLPFRPDFFYDRPSKTWWATCVDIDGFQVGDVELCFSKEDAVMTSSDMVAEATHIHMEENANDHQRTN